MQENEGYWVSPNVEVTPAVKRAINAMNRANPTGDAWHHFRVEQKSYGTIISAYIQGYVTKTVRGRVSVMPSVGGDYNIPFQDTPDREVEERVIVNLWIEFNKDGSTTIELTDRWGDRKVVFKGRGFGKKAQETVVDAADTFRHWRKRFEEEDV